MRTNKSNFTQLDGFSNNNEMLVDAQSKGLLFTSIEIEYKRKSSTLYTRGDGNYDFSLTNSYYNQVEQQLVKFKEHIILPLINKLNCSFLLTIDVLQNGKLNLETLQLELRVECPKGLGYLQTLEEAFRVMMPFTDYISNLYVKGHRHELAVVRSEMNISSEDLIETIIHPQVDDFIQKQWHDFGIIAYREAKQQYQLNVKIPFTYGEFTWDNVEKKIRLQQQEKIVGGY